MYHIETAYTQKGSYTKNKDKGFALLLYRYIANSQAWPTEGQLRAMTMVYQDLFKGVNDRGTMMCMNRGALRFDRNVTVCRLRILPTKAGINPSEIVAKLITRATTFHRVITGYNRDGLEPTDKILPADANIPLVD